MHTFSETAAGVPAFLAKLWRLVEDPDTNHLIYWQSDGRSFVIQNQAQFARELLPLNYKHNNMASFIRQLNMYGFHKITSIENGGLKFDKDEMEFSHPCFQKEQAYLLEHIKRKIANPKQPPAPYTGEEKATIKSETVNKVMSDMKVMRTRQETLDSRFSAMKQENEALWREIAVLRQKHLKQQQIVNKLIQFLVTLVQPSRGGGGINSMSGVKRRFQLMINDVPESSKMRKTNEDSLPAIRELTEDLFSDNNYEYPGDSYGGDDDDGDTASPHVQSPDVRSNHDHDMDDISSPQHMHIEQGTTIVDHPDSDTDEEHQRSNNHGHVGDSIDYIISDIVNPKTVSRAASDSGSQDDWISLNVPSSNMIKQEEPDPLVISSIHEAYDNVTDSSQFDYDQQVSKEEQRGKKILGKRSTPQNGGNSLLNRKRTVPPLHIKIEKNTKGNFVEPPVACSSNSSPAAKTISMGGKVVPGKVVNMAKTSSGKIVLSPVRSAGGRAAASKSMVTPASTATSSSSSATITSGKKTTPVKNYTNKNDFISTEMPNELFDSADGSVSPLTDSLITGSYNPTLSEDYTKKLYPGGSGAGTSSDSKNLAITKYNKKYKGDDLARLHSVEDVNMQLDNIQGDLESIKELFKGGDDYSLDANALLGNSSGGLQGKNRLMLSPSVDSEILSKIFGELDSPFGLSLNSDFGLDNRVGGNDSTSAGSELMAYQPYNSQLDLSEYFNSPSNMDHLADTDAATTSAGDDQNDKDAYMDQELNTPSIERKSISFKTK